MNQDQFTIHVGDLHENCWHPDCLEHVLNCNHLIGMHINHIYKKEILCMFLSQTMHFSTLFFML